MAEQLAGRGLASVLRALDSSLRDLSGMAGDTGWQARLRLAVLCSLQQQAVQQALLEAQALLARCNACGGGVMPIVAAILVGLKCANIPAPVHFKRTKMVPPQAAAVKRPRL